MNSRPIPAMDDKRRELILAIVRIDPQKYDYFPEFLREVERWAREERKWGLHHEEATAVEMLYYHRRSEGV